MLIFVAFALAIPAEDQAPPEPPDADFDGWAAFDDCNDFDATVYPTAPDICDGKDNDCDGLIDEVDTGSFFLYVDADGDGFGLTATELVENPSMCPLPAGYAIQAGDCDDQDVSIHPNAVDDQCDGIDDDCDFLPDDDAPTAGLWFYDLDLDGHAGGGLFGCAEPGATEVFSDCDDTDPSIFVGATEIFEDGIDQDCDGLDSTYADADGDGFNEIDDCDDLSVSVNPAAPEACGNSVDDNCDGRIDEDCTSPDVPETKGCSTAGSWFPWAFGAALLVRRQR